MSSMAPGADANGVHIGRLTGAEAAPPRGPLSRRSIAQHRASCLLKSVGRVLLPRDVLQDGSRDQPSVVVQAAPETPVPCSPFWAL
jgi:hypothetical protein